MSIDNSDSAGEAAVSYTNEFLVAAVRAIDAQFGDGYAKAHPELVGQYIVASATNLTAFMQASMAMESSGLGALMSAMEEGLPVELPLAEPSQPPAKPKSRSRRKAS